MEVPKKLSRQAIDEFKRIYAAEYGEAISDEEATEIGLRLLRLFQILSEAPLPEGDQKLPPVNN